MKPISETKALDCLATIKTDLRSEISNFESRAKSCATCETPGACCLDAHFVNVHISRLEAVAIRNALTQMPPDLVHRVKTRIDESISKYGLTAEGDTFARTYACPLFEKGIGCLVHNTAKPAACITHACYENKIDLPPEDLQTDAERQIDDLNTRTYNRRNRGYRCPLRSGSRASGRPMSIPRNAVRCLIQKCGGEGNKPRVRA